MDTTWEQIYFCLRTGYYNEALHVAESSRSSQQHFSPMLKEWVATRGTVATAALAFEEIEKFFKMNQLVRSKSDKKKLLLYSIISGSRRQIERIWRNFPKLFDTIEDLLWYRLSCMHDVALSPSVVFNNGVAPYGLDDLQSYLNRYEPSHYTKNGTDPLLYPYVLLLSSQLLPAIMHMSQETGDEGHNIDAIHIAITLVDHSLLSEGTWTGQKLRVMDANAEASRMIRQYGSIYLHHGDLQMTLEYYTQAAIAVGGGQVAWTERSDDDQQSQQNVLKQLLTEILSREGGIPFLLGVRGSGEEGELGRSLPDSNLRQQFLIEAAFQFQEAGAYDKSVEIQKRVGAFSSALETINKFLSEAICSLLRGRSDVESRIAGLSRSGEDICEAYILSPECSDQEGGQIIEQEQILRDLEAIVSIYKLVRRGNHSKALKEVAKLPFLYLDPSLQGTNPDEFHRSSSYFQICVPRLLKVVLTCLDDVPGTDTDEWSRGLKFKIAEFLESNVHGN